MASRTRPPPREHESFAGDLVAKASTLLAQGAVSQESVVAQSRQSTEFSTKPYLDSGDSDDLYQETRRAPPRAIFSNLETAVSSIRSGSVRDQHRSDPSQIDKDEAVPTQHVDPSVQEFPDISKGARLSQSMNLELETTSIPELRQHSTQLQESQQAWNPIRRTLAALSSSFSGEFSSELGLNSQYTSDALEPAKKRASGRISEIFHGKEKSTPVLPIHHVASKGHWSRIRNRIPQPSLQEGSTIENILRQYKNSDAESYTSPDRPTLTFDRNLSGISDANGFFSDADHEGRSCQGRQYLPQDYTTQRDGLPRSVARNDISTTGTSSDDQEASDLADITDIRSDYKPRRTRPSDNFPPNYEGSHSDRSRLPLEQAIMQLRWRSDISISSEGSQSTIRGYPRNQVLPHGSPTRAHIEHQQPQCTHPVPLSRPDSDLISLDDETRRVVETAVFYDEASINPEWNAEDVNDVRIPIQNASRQHPVRETSEGNIPEDDAEDWETIVTERPHRGGSPRPQLGHGQGAIYQTFSSIMDASDNGTTSSFEEMSRFDSTERIVQHPRMPCNDGEYRQLNLKEGKMPVIAPKFKDHRVNGYPADSLRMRPVQQYYTTPSPLTDSHKNPFISKPPEVMPLTSRKPTGMPQTRENRNPFSPSSSSIETNDNEPFPRAHSLIPKIARANQLRERLENEGDVDYDSIFSTESSIATNRPRQLGYGGEMDWDYQTSFAGPLGYQHRGRQINTNSFNNNELPQAQADGFSEASLYAGNHDCSTRSPQRPRHIPIEIPSESAPNPMLARPEHMFEIEDPESVEENCRQEKISCICLWICQLFPPFNILFAAGAFDLLMLFFTRGQIRKFSYKKKQHAGCIFMVWFLLSIVAAVIFLGVRISQGINPGVANIPPPL
jgi:hypothetical protein